ncbi:hypothetical protein C6Q04_32010 [Burkholderia multivorans]|nr:hypothetical protein C6Q04_32010 [Burkholderia multivorans]PRG50423.1 hypothetical protein C6T63_18165 [Burkholderia multivorans]
MVLAVILHFSKASKIESVGTLLAGYFVASACSGPRYNEKQSGLIDEGQHPQFLRLTFRVVQFGKRKVVFGLKLLQGCAENPQSQSLATSNVKMAIFVSFFEFAADVIQYFEQRRPVIIKPC